MLAFFRSCSSLFISQLAKKDITKKNKTKTKKLIRSLLFKKKKKTDLLTSTDAYVF